MKIFSTTWCDQPYSDSDCNARHPIGSKIRLWHLKEPVRIEQIEERQNLAIEKMTPKGRIFLPFGWRHAEWSYFKSRVNPKRLWAFRLTDVENEWRISHWEGYAEKRWFGCSAVFVTDRFTEFPKWDEGLEQNEENFRARFIPETKEAKEAREAKEAKEASDLIFSIPEFLKRPAE